MAAKAPTPRDVADAFAFVKQYYTVLSKSPENALKFYAESSLLGWPESDGVITPVTTLKAINDKILSSNYKNCFPEVYTLDAQASQDGGVFVAVTGSFLEKEKVTTIFFQTFFLARQRNGFFILNDILRLFDACVSGADDAPTVQASDISALDDTVAKVYLSTSSDASAEKASSVVELAANASLVARTSNANVSPAAAPAVQPTSNANVSPVVAPAAKNVNVSPAVAPAAKKTVPSDVAPASNVPLKITYATVVAKTTPVSSPRAAPVTPRAAPVTLANSAPKPSAPPLANGAPKPLASVTKVTAKSKTGGNSAPDTIARPEGRSVYLGNLPYDVTKQRVAEVLRKFGPIRRHADSVQIRRHSEDGFCCAFVEFESPDSARAAVKVPNVNFGDKVAYIAYKKSSYNRGSRFTIRAIRGGYRNVNENQSGRARATERSPSSGQGAR